MGNTQGKPTAFSDQAVNLNQFRLLRVVGKGAFGKVRIVERKDTGLTFALKYILKEEVVKSESDVEYIYIVVDLMTGGDLRFHISRKTFTEEAIRFWIAELACALRYCHSQGIIHRDVKPDNVLLDSEGHVHLADFNVASDYKPNKKLTSKSGTMAYLAPEVYEGRGYLTEVDWWSLGVLFYECIYSKRPFDGKTSDQLAANIKRAQPKYYVTNPAVTIPCLRAIAGLLEKDITKRIGASSWSSFIHHPFFAEIDFEALVRKEVDPIFRPSSDKTNFDATYDLEELLLEEAPLEARARRQKPRAELKDDATAKEIREDELHKMMETLFEPFDYTTAGFNEAAPSEVVVPDAPLEQPPPIDGSHQRPHSPHRTTQQMAAVPINKRRSRTQITGQVESQSYSPYSHSHPDTTHRMPCQLGIDGTDRSLVPPTSRPFSNPPLDREKGSPATAIGQVLYGQGDAVNQSAPLPPPSRPPPPIPDDGSSAQRSISYPSPTIAAADGPPRHSYNPGSGSKKYASKAGGVQMILDETGTWSNLADHHSSVILDNDGQPTNKPGGRISANGGNSSSGVFSFFSRKKARDRSPKPTEPGVLGKEGARQIIS
ncbi:hypothetical protein KEM56_001656 [Ascosphaera pollenicola]|nr:hypothetical protein KEM56_001656 [Ascosphaera pollenicola]